MKGWGMLEATATRFDRMNLEVCRWKRIRPRANDVCVSAIAPRMWPRSRAPRDRRRRHRPAECVNPEVKRIGCRGGSEPDRAPFGAGFGSIAGRSEACDRHEVDAAVVLSDPVDAARLTRPAGGAVDD